jgi:hypothetical protein
MLSLLGAVASPIVGILFLLSLPFWFLLSVSLPWCIWSATRNLAKTRRALERIADAVDAGHRPGGGGVLGI